MLWVFFSLPLASTSRFSWRSRNVSLRETSVLRRSSSVARRAIPWGSWANRTEDSQRLAKRGAGSFLRFVTGSGYRPMPEETVLMVC